MDDRLKQIKESVDKVIEERKEAEWQKNSGLISKFIGGVKGCREKVEEAKNNAISAYKEIERLCDEVENDTSLFTQDEKEQAAEYKQQAKRDCEVANECFSEIDSYYREVNIFKSGEGKSYNLDEIVETIENKFKTCRSEAFSVNFDCNNLCKTIARNDKLDKLYVLIFGASDINTANTHLSALETAYKELKEECNLLRNGRGAPEGDLSDANAYEKEIETLYKNAKTELENAKKEYEEFKKFKLPKSKDSKTKTNTKPPKSKSSTTEPSNKKKLKLFSTLALGIAGATMFTGVATAAISNAQQNKQHKLDEETTSKIDTLETIQEESESNLEVQNPSIVETTEETEISTYGQDPTEPNVDYSIGEEISTDMEEPSQVFDEVETTEAETTTTEKSSEDAETTTTQATESTATQETKAEEVQEQNTETIRIGTVVQGIDINGLEFKESVDGGKEGHIGSELSPEEAYYVIDRWTNTGDRGTYKHVLANEQIEIGEDTWVHISKIEGAQTPNEARSAKVAYSKGETTEAHIDLRGWVKASEIAGRLNKQKQENVIASDDEQKSSETKQENIQLEDIMSLGIIIEGSKLEGHTYLNVKSEKSTFEHNESEQYYVFDGYISNKMSEDGKIIGQKWELNGIDDLKEVADYIHLEEVKGAESKEEAAEIIVKSIKENEFSESENKDDLWMYASEVFELVEEAREQNNGEKMETVEVEGTSYNAQPREMEAHILEKDNTATETEQTKNKTKNRIRIESWVKGSRDKNSLQTRTQDNKKATQRASETKETPTEAKKVKVKRRMNPWTVDEETVEKTVKIGQQFGEEEHLWNQQKNQKNNPMFQQKNDGR